MRQSFDYDGALLWNNLVGELWRRTTIYLPRALARLMGVTHLNPQDRPDSFRGL